MAEVSYETLFKEILVHAPNCPEPVVLNAIGDACYEFCTETLYVTEEIDPITVTANENTYDIDVPRGGYEIVQVVGPIYCSGLKLRRLGHQELHSRHPYDWRQLVSESPTEYVQFARNQLTLIPMPTKDLPDAITGRVALTPLRTATRADSDLLRAHRSDLAAGALARICAIPDQPYTHEDKAIFYGRVFSAAKGAASARVRSSFNNAPLRVVFNRYW